MLGALTSFLNLVLHGNTPDALCPFFLKASLVALNDTDGGVRPIAIGSTLSRLAAKYVENSLKQSMDLLLVPYQLRYSPLCGAEAMVHVAQVYLESLQPEVVIKFDFRNAFNSICCDKMFTTIDQLAPKILPFVYLAYSS